jgi:iron complex transport system permease protein
MTSARTNIVWLIPTVVVLGTMLILLSLLTGTAPVSMAEAMAALTGRAETSIEIIVFEIRLPRTLLALLIGAGLGMSGAALQSLLTNPLAEPGIIGVSALSALGAVVVFYSGMANTTAFALPLGGIVGALISVALLFALAGRHVGTLTLILAGVAINSIGAALTALILNLSPNPFAAYEIIFWLMGSLTNRSFDHVWMVLPLALVGWTLLIIAARPLELLALGNDVATTLGANLRRARLFVILGTALAVGSGVAVAGIVGFVGLIVPHLLRPVVGHRPSVLIPLSGCGGALLTLAADIGTRVVSTGSELKLGVLTALVGAPFFLHLVLKMRASEA